MRAVIHSKKGVLWGVVGACCGCASGLEIHRNVETMEGGLRGQGGSQTDGHSWDWGWRQVGTTLGVGTGKIDFSKLHPNLQEKARRDSS